LLTFDLKARFALVDKEIANYDEEGALDMVTALKNAEEREDKAGFRAM
jgi:hypothetical protein